MTNPAPASLVERFKELGFNWKPIYELNHKQLPLDHPFSTKYGSFYDPFHTFDQLRDWLWEKHGLHCNVQLENTLLAKKMWSAFIEVLNTNEESFFGLGKRRLYSSTCFAYSSLALTDALDKACDILKERKG